jgi:hypothetical protein
MTEAQRIQKKSDTLKNKNAVTLKLADELQITAQELVGLNFKYVPCLGAWIR